MDNFIPQGVDRLGQGGLSHRCLTRESLIDAFDITNTMFGIVSDAKRLGSSSAAFFMVGASIAAGSDILLEHVGINPTRDGVITRDQDSRESQRSYQIVTDMLGARE